MTKGHPVGRAFRRYLVAGLVVIAPVTVTLVVLWWIFERLDSLLGRFLYERIGVPVPGLGLLALIALLLVVGWATQRAIGARALQIWHDLLERFPLTRKLYGASNRIIRTLLGEQQHFFREVVVFEYPSPGRWSIGFVTARVPDGARDVVSDDAVTVFVPTSPNPTSGWLVMVPRERVTVLPMTPEEGITFVLSLGTVMPGAAAAPVTNAGPPAEPPPPIAAP